MNTGRTQVLVSVRNASEAAIAVESSVNIIDVKEPTRGALGAADLKAVEEICRVVAGRRPVSVALGELLEPRRYLPSEIPPGVIYAKLGLANCGPSSNWQRLLRSSFEQFPADVQPVMVVYADAGAHSPSPAEVIEFAEGADCGIVLVDTYAKEGKGLLDYWTPAELERFVRKLASRDMKCVVAGGLQADDLSVVLGSRPWMVGVRGAVCAGNRRESLHLERLEQFLDAVARTHELRELPARNNDVVA